MIFMDIHVGGKIPDARYCKYKCLVQCAKAHKARRHSPSKDPTEVLTECAKAQRAQRHWPTEEEQTEVLTENPTDSQAAAPPSAARCPRPSPPGSWAPRMLEPTRRTPCPAPYAFTQNGSRCSPKGCWGARGRGTPPRQNSSGRRKPPACSCKSQSQITQIRKHMVHAWSIAGRPGLRRAAWEPAVPCQTATASHCQRHSYAIQKLFQVAGSSGN